MLQYHDIDKSDIHAHFLYFCHRFKFWSATGAKYRTIWVHGRPSHWCWNKGELVFMKERLNMNCHCSCGNKICFCGTWTFIKNSTVFLKVYEPDKIPFLLMRNIKYVLRWYIWWYIDEPRTRLKFGDRAFSISAPRLWNALPHHLKDSTSCQAFKKCLKTHLVRLAHWGAVDYDSNYDFWTFYEWKWH